MIDHKTCGSKKQYWDETTASIYADKVANKHGKPMRYYRCPTCKGYHLSRVRSPRPVNER